jgi:hypothetical protein
MESLLEGTERIQSEQFKDSSLLQIKIPKSVTTIESSAFKNCKMLTKVIFEEGSLL